MSTYDPRWDDALDALEAEVAQLEFGLASGNLEQIAAVGRWNPPDDLPVMPLELADRAADLARRMEVTETQARDIRAELKSELDNLGARRNAAAAYISHDTLDA